MSVSDKAETNDKSKKNKAEKKSQQVETDDQRSLGETEKDKKVKKLKTVDSVAENASELSEDEMEGDEYQHIKDAQDNYKLTLDNATEKQSKQIKHEDESIEDEHENTEETFLEVEDDEQPSEENIKDLKEIDREKISKEKSKETNKEKSGESLFNEVLDIDGEEIKTINVPRGTETTAHFQKHIVMDSSFVEELNAQQVTDLRKMYIEELTSNNIVNILYEPTFHGIINLLCNFRL